MKDRSLIKDCLKGDIIVWIVYMLLCLISIIEVFSATSSLSFETGDYLAPIKLHSLMLMGGTVVVIIVHHIPVKYFRLVPYICIPGAIILLSAVMLMGMINEARINGAARWIFGFQPSELAKMGVITWVAYLLAKFQKEEGCSPEAFKPILIATGVILALIAPENASTALLLATVVYLMMVIGRIPTRQILKLTGVVILIGGLTVTMILTVPPSVYKDIPGTHRFVTWRNRIIDYFNNEEIPPAKFDIDGKAQFAHANIAIATSHIIGKGPGNSTQRDHLSHGYSDFIYAITIEEMGLAGGAFVILLYLILLYRAGLIAKKCNKLFPAFLVMGVTLMLVCQAILHMMVSVGLFPVTGQPLPLISKGGTSILFNCIYIGMILSVSRSIEKEQEEEGTEEESEEEQVRKVTSDIS